MKGFSLFLLLIFSVVLLYASEEDTLIQEQECKCEEGEENCQCSKVARPHRKYAMIKPGREVKLIKKAGKVVLNKAKKKCHTLVDKLKKTAAKVLIIQKELKKHCKDIKGMPKIKGIIRDAVAKAAKLQGKIKMAGKPKLGRVKKVKVHTKCLSLQKKLEESAARAKILQAEIIKHCKDKVKGLPVPLQMKLLKVSRELKGIKKRAKTIKKLFKKKDKLSAKKVKAINMKIQALKKKLAKVSPMQKKKIIQMIKKLAAKKQQIVKKAVKMRHKKIKAHLIPGHPVSGKVVKKGEKKCSKLEKQLKKTFKNMKKIETIYKVEINKESKRGKALMKKAKKIKMVL